MQIDFNRNGMLDRSEIGAFVAATDFQIAGSDTLHHSISEFRDRIFVTMATTRGLAGVNGAVMFGDWVVFVLKYRKRIPKFRWMKLLRLKESCNESRPAHTRSTSKSPHTLPKNMILVPSEVKLGTKIGTGSFGVSHMHAHVCLT